MAPRRGGPLAPLVLALLAGASVQRASAAGIAGLKVPSMPWFSALRGGYVDLAARRPVNEAGPAPDGAAPAAPSRAARGAARDTELGFFEKCVKENDELSALVTKCNYDDTFTTCDMLAEQGFLPKGVQGFEASSLTGTFNMPIGCASASLGVSYDANARVTFNSPQVPVLAIITKDGEGAMVSYLGSGSTQGRVKHRLASRAEFCYAPSANEVTVSKSAVYSTGMQAGTASWTFSKSVALGGPYANNRAVMFNGDSANAAWTLTARKSGADANYQGVVSGTITINNPTRSAMAVTSIIDQISGGPAATVACPVGVPFAVPACSYATCQYTAYYPTAPAAGTYTSAAQVQFQVQGAQGYPSAASGTAIFNVGSTKSLSALETSVGTIPSGGALVTDPSSPQKQYLFNGPGTQEYTTKLECDGGTSDSGATTTTATLTGSNGQQISQSATVRKQCYDLRVSVASKAAPYVGRWGWSVSKSASPNGGLSLKPDASYYADGRGEGAFGADYAATTAGDIVYSVTYTRAPPAGFKSGAPAFEASGEVSVKNPAPINARLQGVYVSISNSRGGQPFIAQATCPVLTIPAGQKVTCSWTAAPSFNPAGQQVRATARYVNTHNGEARGSTTDFNSAPATVGGGLDDDEPQGGRRRLAQTWGGWPANARRGDPAPTIASTVFGLNGQPLIVPSSVADNTGVIVSGQSAVGGAGTAPGDVAMTAAGGVPVILPSRPSGANLGAFVNEGGPAAAMGEALSGLEDECVDVADTFLTGNNTVPGRLINGSPPSGRVCSTTTFTYTMRYGPYADCVPRKSVNAATFSAVDSGVRGSSQADIPIRVEGCANPGVLRVAPLKTQASAKGGFAWSVATHADQEEVVLGQDASATVTYTVDLKRSGARAGATIVAEAAVANPGAYPVSVEDATYTATTICSGTPRTTSGPVTCDAASVPAKGEIKCSLTAAVPCAGDGAWTLVLTAGGGYTVTSQPTPFAFNTQALEEQNSGSACAEVVEGFKSGPGLVEGTVVAGARPAGRICMPGTYTYTVKLGPFGKCGSFKAVNAIAIASKSKSPAVTGVSALPVSVVGCNLYLEMARAADCVNPAPYWTKCDADADAKCASGWRLLPGGGGKATPFFPKRGAEASARSYAAVLNSAAGADVSPSRRAYVIAARQYVAAQLNFLSGARLPSVQLQEAYDSLGSFLAATSEGAELAPEMAKAVEVQALLLARYSAGALPAGSKAPPRCRA